MYTVSPVDVLSLSSVGKGAVSMFRLGWECESFRTSGKAVLTGDSVAYVGADGSQGDDLGDLYSKTDYPSQYLNSKYENLLQWSRCRFTGSY